MSRIQTRISDFGTAEVRRPTISDTVVGWGCEFLLQGASAPNTPLGKLPVMGHSVPVPRVIAGSLFECQYRLVQHVGAFGGIATTSVASCPPEEAESGRRRHSPATEMKGSLPELDSIRVVEHSVMWQTTGKGDRDFGIHLFERRKVLVSKDGQIEPFAGIHGPAIFKTVSPLAPSSYHSQLISIDWMVRVRVFLDSGHQLRFEQPFQLAVDASSIPG